MNVNYNNNRLKLNNLSPPWKYIDYKDWLSAIFNNDICQSKLKDQILLEINVCINVC